MIMIMFIKKKNG